VQITSEALAAYFRVVLPLLDERQRRLVAAAMVTMLGPGGQARVAEATGLSRNTLIGGARELEGGAGPSDRVRRPGGGRKKATDLDPDLLAALDSLVDPESRGDPMSPLRWTLKSTRRLATELTRMGHQASSFLVGQLLHYMDYSLQGTSKQNEGTQHADRDAQFHHINAQATRNAGTARSTTGPNDPEAPRTRVVCSVGLGCNGATRHVSAAWGIGFGRLCGAMVR